MSHVVASAADFGATIFAPIARHRYAPPAWSPCECVWIRWLTLSTPTAFIRAKLRGNEDVPAASTRTPFVPDLMSQMSPTYACSAPTRPTLKTGTPDTTPAGGAFATGDSATASA